MKAVKWQNTIYVSATIEDIQDDKIKALCEAAKKALIDAYAIYSTYKVGSAVLMSNGEIVTGSNQENAVYPLGLCAERVAIFSAATRFPKEKIEAIAVATTKKLSDGEMPAFPCGSCRQVMVEQETRYNSAIPIYVVNSDPEVYMITSVKDILPFAFDGRFLE
jgi:cytidine deaminase